MRASDDGPFDLGQFLLGLQLEDGNLAPGLQFVRLLARRRIRLVDHAGAQLNEALDLAFRRLPADSQGQLF